jgi:hypothetical protein
VNSHFGRLTRLIARGSRPVHAGTSRIAPLLGRVPEELGRSRGDGPRTAVRARLYDTRLTRPTSSWSRLTSSVLPDPDERQVLVSFPVFVGADWQAVVKAADRKRTNHRRFHQPVLLTV